MPGTPEMWALGQIMELTESQSPHLQDGNNSPLCQLEDWCCGASDAALGSSKGRASLSARFTYSR